jgi:hypothetical protein
MSHDGFSHSEVVRLPTLSFVQGVFGQVQVMADFEHRFSATVSYQAHRNSHLAINLMLA